MRIQVNGKHIDVGDALRTHVSDRLLDVVEKYADRPVEAVVTFSKSGHEFVADTSIHLSTGLTAQAKAHDHEIYASFDNAAERLEKQLRRYKRRLKQHHHKRQTPVEGIDASSYIIEAEFDEDAQDENDVLQPVIVAEMQTRVQSLSVGEAVMQMELAHAPLLVFRNDAHGGVNVVYKREDGNIGWIDPRGMEQKAAE